MYHALKNNTPIPNKDPPCGAQDMVMMSLIAALEKQTLKVHFIQREEAKANIENSDDVDEIPFTEEEKEDLQNFMNSVPTTSLTQGKAKEIVISEEKLKKEVADLSEQLEKIMNDNKMWKAVCDEEKKNVEKLLREQEERNKAQKDAIQKLQEQQQELFKQSEKDKAVLEAERARAKEEMSKVTQQLANSQMENSEGAKRRRTDIEDLKNHFQKTIDE